MKGVRRSEETKDLDGELSTEQAIALSKKEKRTVKVWRREHLVEGLAAVGGKLTQGDGVDKYKGPGWSVHLRHVPPGTGKEAW